MGYELVFIWLVSIAGAYAIGWVRGGVRVLQIERDDPHFFGTGATPGSGYTKVGRT